MHPAVRCRTYPLGSSAASVLRFVTTASPAAAAAAAFSTAAAAHTHRPQTQQTQRAAFAYQCTLHRYPPPFLLPADKEGLSIPSQLIQLHPPASKPLIAAGSELLRPPHTPTPAARGSAAYAAADATSTWLRDTHMLLKVVRYERQLPEEADEASGGKGAAQGAEGTQWRSVTTSTAVLTAGDSISDVLLPALQSMLHPHVLPTHLDQSAVLVDRAPGLPLVPLLRALVGAPPASQRRSTRMLKPLQATQLAGLFGKAAPYVRLRLAPGVTLLESSGELAGTGSAAPSTGATSPEWLLPLNSGLPVSIGRGGVLRHRKQLGLMILLVLLAFLATLSDSGGGQGQGQGQGGSRGTASSIDIDAKEERLKEAGVSPEERKARIRQLFDEQRRQKAEAAKQQQQQQQS